MTETQTTSRRIGEPSGHRSHATMAEARGRIVFLPGMPARGPDGTIVGLGDIGRRTGPARANRKAAVAEPGGTLDEACRGDVVVRSTEQSGTIHAVRRRHVASASTIVETPRTTTPAARIGTGAIAVLQG
ncbi:MAG: hypothetical protein K2X11_01610 [Acetobacteraceae bacterium]|nr:hypothetical protein [Acetobacteraceae bacterium]